MSLTRHIKIKSSPVRAWLEETFPHTRAVATKANCQLRGSNETCLVPCPEGSDPGLVGTGVDYLLRACLRASSLDSSAASRGTERLTQMWPQLKEPAEAIEREAVGRIQKIKPDTRQLSDAEWAELCVLCLVLARFEQPFRIPGGMSRGVFEHLVQPLKQCRTLDELIPLTLTEPSIRDLEYLGRTAWEDHQELRRAHPLHLNPKFSLSSALGGADADFIAERTLIDWKATKEPGIRRRELWQLVGYALADTRDQYELKEVGIRSLRWRSIVTWPLTDLLTELSLGKASKPVALGGILEFKPVELDALRREFAQIVKAARREKRQKVATRRYRQQAD